MDRKNGKMGHFIEVSTEEVKSKGKGRSFGEMIAPMRESSRRIIFMEKGNIYGKMVEFSMENGITIKCMGKEYSLGQMDAGMRVLTRMIKNMGLEFLLSEMGAFMRASGKTGSNMDVASIGRKRCQEREFGKMGFESSGWMRNKMRKKFKEKNRILCDLKILFLKVMLKSIRTENRSF